MHVFIVVANTTRFSSFTAFIPSTQKNKPKERSKKDPSLGLLGTSAYINTVNSAF